MSLNSLKALWVTWLKTIEVLVRRGIKICRDQLKKLWKIFLSWNPKKRALVLVTILGCIVLLCIFINAVSTYVENEELLKAESAPIPVITAAVKSTTAPQSIAAVGNMQAILSVPVSFDTDGMIDRIFAKDGEQVKKGQLLASLASKADEAQLESYQANLSLQKSTYQRMKSIENTGAISQQMLDSQKALWLQAEAQVNQQKIVIKEKKFYAPFDGVLSNFTASAGSYLAKGTGIATLVQEAPLVVQYTLPISDRPVVELGQPVTVVSAAYPNQSFSGVLSYVSPVASSSSGTMTLQATVKNNDFLLLPGMFVSVTQMVNANRQLPMMPDVALMADIVGQYVFKVDDHRVHKVYVKVGESIGNLVPIESGLSVGDTIVIAGQQKLKENSPVTDLDDPKLVFQILGDSYGANS